MGKNKGWSDGELRRMSPEEIEAELKYWQMEKTRQEHIKARRDYQKRKRSFGR